MDKIKQVLLVAPDDLKGGSYINYNVDDSLIGPTIRETQEVHLQAIIGSNLFYRLQELVYAEINEQLDGINAEENERYKELLDDYVQPYLTAKCQAVLCLPLAYKTRNIGVAKTDDENIRESALREVMAVQRRYNEMAARYATYLSKYLCAHKDEFEELSQNDCGCGMFVPPVLGKTFVHTGLVLGSTKNKCNC